MTRQKGKRSTARDYEQRLMGGARCPEPCGSVRYLTKKAAKTSARRMKGRKGRLNAYPCGEFWHLGRLPAEVKAGLITRDEITFPRRTA